MTLGFDHLSVLCQSVAEASVGRVLTGQQTVSSTLVTSVTLIPPHTHTHPHPLVLNWIRLHQIHPHAKSTVGGGVCMRLASLLACLEALPVGQRPGRPLSLPSPPVPPAPPSCTAKPLLSTTSPDWFKARAPASGSVNTRQQCRDADCAMKRQNQKGTY